MLLMHLLAIPIFSPIYSLLLANGGRYKLNQGVQGKFITNKATPMIKTCNCGFDMRAIWVPVYQVSLPEKRKHWVLMPEAVCKLVIVLLTLSS